LTWQFVIDSGGRRVGQFLVQVGFALFLPTTKVGQSGFPKKVLAPSADIKTE
jgi:hypothetical protein